MDDQPNGRPRDIDQSLSKNKLKTERLLRGTVARPVLTVEGKTGRETYKGRGKGTTPTRLRLITQKSFDPCT